MMQWVVRERFESKWVSTYFENSAKAHNLCKKILQAGGAAICIRSAR